MIPEDVKREVRRTLGEHITSEQSVSGGSVNRAARAELADGRVCFIKWNRTAGTDMFEKEQRGLELLASAGTGIRIPEVYASGAIRSGTGFLLQEYIEQGNSTNGSDEAFGRELAALHRHTEERYGLDYDNYIGRLPQSNTWHKGWTDFFIEERMEPQLEMAVDAGKLGSGTVVNFESLYRKLPDIFPDDSPALLHGDLWGGNYFYDAEGHATIYDPAVYYGHREIELAFTYLFGGYSSRFYEAYREAYPLQPGFSSRKDIYNLYPLLVHTNLFGGTYGRQVESIVRRF